MTDDLRTRIAQVQSEHQARANSCLCGWKYDPIADDSHFDHVADVLIRELGMRENFAVADEDGDFVYVGADRETSDKYTVHPGDHLLHRYVTEWTTDD